MHIWMKKSIGFDEPVTLFNGAQVYVLQDRTIYTVPQTLGEGLIEEGLAEQVLKGAPLIF